MAIGFASWVLLLTASGVGLEAARRACAKLGGLGLPPSRCLPPPRGLALRGGIGVDVTFGAPGTRCFAPAEGAGDLSFIFDRGALRRASDRPAALAWLAAACEQAGELLPRYRFGVTQGVAWLKTGGPYEPHDASVTAALADGGSAVAAAWRSLADDLGASAGALPEVWSTERPLRLDGNHRGRCFTVETIRLGRDTETRVSLESGAQHFLPDVVPTAASVRRTVEELAEAAPSATPYR